MILLDPDLDSPHSPEPLAGARLPSARALTRFLKLAQAAVRLRGQVTVLLTTDAAVKDLNRRFRHKNKTTDVLSFPAASLRQSREKIAGDLAISVSTAQRQAVACGHSLGTELKVLMLHGLLHLAGYDHEADEGQMARRELWLRGRLGLPQGLIERSTQDSRSPVSKATPRLPGKVSTPGIRRTAGGRRAGARGKAGAR